MKTLAQLAAELNVSKSTIYRTIHQNGFRTIQQGNKKLIDESAEQAIVEVLKGKTIQTEQFKNDSETTQNDSERFSLNGTESKMIDVLKAQIADKDNQISLLQSQITELKADKAKLNERLDMAETNISNLTTALTAAQALHGMDKQQAAIEVKQVNDSEPAEQETQNQPPQKHSFFQRLFKRSKNN